MTSHFGVRLTYLLSLVVLAGGCVGVVQARSASSAPDTSVVLGRPSISIQSPTSDESIHGVAIIRFRTENISITSPFLPADQHRGPFPAGHVHVTVDGATWHWVHSTSDPVVITPLTPGAHTVALELAGADHRPLDSRTVRFTVVQKALPSKDHADHR